MQIFIVMLIIAKLANLTKKDAFALLGNVQSILKKGFFYNLPRNQLLNKYLNFFSL
jgi:hypothetical protein